MQQVAVDSSRVVDGDFVFILALHTVYVHPRARKQTPVVLIQLSLGWYDFRLVRVS